MPWQQRLDRVALSLLINHVQGQLARFFSLEQLCHRLSASNVSLDKINASRLDCLPARGSARSMSQLRRRDTQDLASLDPDHCVEPCGMRLHHSPEPSFGQFNHPVIMEDEIEVWVEANAVYRKSASLP
jgi:hypothetical protein